MRITESKLRRIIRSVIRESAYDDYESATAAYDADPHNLDAYDAMRDAESLDREEALAHDSSLPTHDTYTSISQQAMDICDELGLECSDHIMSAIEDDLHHGVSYQNAKRNAEQREHDVLRGRY